MTAVAFVAYCGQLAGLPPADAMQRAHEVLYYVGLGEARYRNVETYSTGMKQRIKLAQALVHDPDLLFLDEPTNGMDPKGRDEMLELIRDLAHNKGVNLILSSHLLPDVEFTCDHVVVMDKGRGGHAGPDRRREGARRARSSSCASRTAPRRWWRCCAPPATRCHDTDDDVMRVFVPGDGDAGPIFALAAANGLQVRHLRPSVPTLEDVFARAVGERLAMPIHDQGYQRYAGDARPIGRRLAGDRHGRHPHGARPAQVPGAAALAWVPFLVRAVQIYVAANFPQASFLPAQGRDLPRVPRASRASSSSSSPSTSAPA